MSFKLLIVVMTSLSTFLLDGMFEVLKRQNTTNHPYRGWDNYWGFFSFKVQSLWSKVQHIYLLSKELPKRDQGIWGHCPSSVLLTGPRFRSMPQWAVRQLLGVWEPKDIFRRTNVGSTFFLPHCWRAGYWLSTLASLNVLHETHTTGVEWIED